MYCEFAVRVVRGCVCVWVGVYIVNVCIVGESIENGPEQCTPSWAGVGCTRSLISLSEGCGCE